MSVTPIKPRNCSAACAEMLGGNCEGDTCIYRPVVIAVDQEWLATWTSEADLDAQYERGMRMGHRYARIQYGRGRFVGFMQGVGAVFACWLALALIEWMAR